MFKLLIGILFFIAPSSKDIDLKVQNYLDLKLKNYESFDFEIMNSPENISEIKIRSDEEFVLSGSVGYIPILAVRKDNTKYNSILSVKIRTYLKVLVAINSIESKTELNPADFEHKLIDVSTLRGEPVEDYLVISSLRSKSFIKAGTVLTQEKTETIPAIFSGDKVLANIKYGNVVVSTDAFARNDGCIGDVISIRTKSNKQFRAKIIDSKNVNIIE